MISDTSTTLEPPAPAPVRLQRFLTRPRACDLFCGAGGAAAGLHRAGFDVEGWDIKPQKNYPYKFNLGNALDADLSGFDFVWASPPCQEHTALRARVGKHYECFIERTRAKLEAWGGPYILENVVGAPLRVDVMLCAVMFGLRSYRHRIFESNWPIKPHPLPHPKHPVPVNRRKKNRRGHWDAGGFVTVVGDIGRYVGPEAMGIDWMTGNELSQAIPPAYSEFLGRQILARLKAGNDLFPGTGIVSRCWSELSSLQPGDTSSEASSDMSCQLLLPTGQAPAGPRP